MLFFFNCYHIFLPELRSLNQKHSKNQIKKTRFTVQYWIIHKTTFLMGSLRIESTWRFYLRAHIWLWWFVIQFGCPRNNVFLSHYVIMSVIMVDIYDQTTRISACVVCAQCKIYNTQCVLYSPQHMHVLHTYSTFRKNGNQPDTCGPIPSTPKTVLKEALHWHAVCIEGSLSKPPHPNCSRRAGCHFAWLTPRCVCECVYECPNVCSLQPEKHISSQHHCKPLLIKLSAEWFNSEGRNQLCVFSLSVELAYGNIVGNNPVCMQNTASHKVLLRRRPQELLLSAPHKMCVLAVKCVCGVVCFSTRI